MLIAHNDHGIGDRVYIVAMQGGAVVVRIGTVVNVSAVFDGGDARIGYTIRSDNGGFHAVNQGHGMDRGHILLAAGGVYTAESLGRTIRDLLIPPPVKAPEPAPAESLGRTIRDLLIPPPVKAPEPAPADAPAPTPEGEEVPF